MLEDTQNPIPTSPEKPETFSGSEKNEPDKTHSVDTVLIPALAPAPKFCSSGFLIGLLLAILTLLFTTEIRESWAAFMHWVDGAGENTVAAPEKSKKRKDLETKVSGLRRAFGQLTPRQPYLIVNSTDNEIYLMNGKKLIHKGTCSTGSFTLLKAADQRQWIFQTPRGMFRVQVKVEAPVWRMPDWAFIEEGLPVPPPDSPERYEYGVLGEYALAFGNGYLVHGTLYQRFLGMPVTHGCVRLGDEDLQKVYFALNIGSKIFIY